MAQVRGYRGTGPSRLRAAVRRGPRAVQRQASVCCTRSRRCREQAPHTLLPQPSAIKPDGLVQQMHTSLAGRRAGCWPVRRLRVMHAAYVCVLLPVSLRWWV